MANISFKAQAVASQLNSLMTQRLGTATIVSSGILQDSDAYPYFTLGTGTAGQSNVLVKVTSFIAAGSPVSFTDSLGNAANPYGPILIQVVLESSDSSHSGSSTPVDGVNWVFPVLGDILAISARTQLYMRANGTKPGISDISSSNLAATYDNLQYPTISST